MTMLPSAQYASGLTVNGARRSSAPGYYGGHGVHLTVDKYASADDDDDDDGCEVDASPSLFDDCPEDEDEVETTTICTTDVAAIQMSPADGSSTGSDAGIWMTSTAQPASRRTNAGRGGGAGHQTICRSTGGSATTGGTPTSKTAHGQPQHRRTSAPADVNGGGGGDADGSNKVCLVCGDAASGHHYGIASCEACKAFFKRTVQGRIQYSCTSDGLCEMTKKRRKSCPACRYEKCLTMGMNPEGIRLDRRKGGRHRHMRHSIDGIRPCDSSSSFLLAHRGDNQMLARLMKIEPPKVFATPDQSVPDDEQKFMTTLSNLADRELVAIISWAKNIPGFSSLPLADEMNLIQGAWLDILCFNLSYRSSTPVYDGRLVFADDLIVSEEDSAKCGIFHELDVSARHMARKLSTLRMTKEEHVLFKTIILLNADINLENPTAVQTLRDQLFDSLFDYEAEHVGSEALHRVGRLMLTLPLLTHEVLLGRRYWLGVKLNGAVATNRLLSELVENTLREDVDAGVGTVGCTADDDIRQG